MSCDPRDRITAIGDLLHIAALHAPDTVPDGEGEAVVCRVCVDDLDQHVPWPCPTRRIADGGTA